MTTFRTTKTPGVYIRHQQHCPAAAQDGSRCRCTPAYRGRRRHPVTGKPQWSRSSTDRAEILTWLGAGRKGGEAARAQAMAGISFGDLSDQWMRGVESGAIGKRRGRKGAGYSETTLAGYRRSLEHALKEEFGAFPAASIEEVEWQLWADRLSREGLSRSRIANHLAVASAIYGWASRATRRLVPRNPTLAVELPPNDEVPRTRVARAHEAAELLAALAPEDQVPYALAFYAGLRRAEIHRLEWVDVDLNGYRLIVRKAKSEAGTDRRPPIAEPLRPILLAARLRAGRPENGRLSQVSVMSGKLSSRATEAWDRANANRGGDGVPALERITLHECRHTYASFLMAAGYTLKELMEFMGHADLGMVQRYVKLLPQPEETNPAERLNRYLAGGAADP
jgi:integrase